MQVKQLLSSQGDWFDSPSDAEKASPQEALRQANNGELVSHEEVVARFKKWL
jgi:predicted transcriptional regulator